MEMETANLAAHRMVAFAALLLIGAGNPGTSVSGSELGAAPVSMKVQLGVRDLSSPAGVAALYVRIRNAARSVCGYADTHFYQAQAVWNDCVDRTIAHAVASVGNAELTAYYLAKAGRARVFPASRASSVVRRVP
jgi:UrcA family protein